MTKDAKDTFVSKAQVVSDNLTRITKLAQKLSPETIELSVVAEISEIVEDIVKARTSLQRYRAMEKLEEHAEHRWLINLAVLAYASRVLDISSASDLDGTRDMIRKFQEDLNEDPTEDAPDNDGKGGIEG